MLRKDKVTQCIDYVGWVSETEGIPPEKPASAPLIIKGRDNRLSSHEVDLEIGHVMSIVCICARACIPDVCLSTAREKF